MRGERVFAGGEGLGDTLLLGCILIPAVTLWFGLNASSLWIDEIFTSFFADPRVAELAGILQRTAQDVHPPLYALSLHFFLQGLEVTPGAPAFDAAMRVFSLLSAVAALGIMFLGLSPFLSLRGRLFLVAFAAATQPLLLAALDARSYAFSWVFSSLLLISGLHLWKAMRDGEGWRTPALGVLLFGILGGFTHYYGLMLAGAMLAVLLLLARGWRERMIIVGIGLLILIPCGGYALWNMTQIRVGLADHWMRNDWAFISEQLSYLRVRFAGSYLGVLPIAFSVAVIGVAALAGRRASEMGRHFMPLVIAAASLFLLILFGLGVSYATVPSFTARSLLVALPFFWLCAALLYELASLRLSALERPAFHALIALFLLANLHIYLAIGQPVRDEWRRSAAYVEGLNQCAERDLPVAGFTGGQIDEPEAPLFYGFYLQRNRGWRFLNVRKGSLSEGRIEGPWADAVMARGRGDDPCPLLLWSVHHLGWEDIDRVRRAIGEALRLEGQGEAADRLRILQFTSFGFGDWGGVYRAERAFAIILSPRPGTGAPASSTPRAAYLQSEALRRSISL
ncbi:MAG: hypothetical protein HXY22_07605 [Alphaproteobacteria bacterium]|nr:hypothetical protein [Alphaproteobacteria bacterium]